MTVFLAELDLDWLKPDDLVNCLFGPMQIVVCGKSPQGPQSYCFQIASSCGSESFGQIIPPFPALTHTGQIQLRVVRDPQFERAPADNTNPFDGLSPPETTGSCAWAVGDFHSSTMPKRLPVSDRTDHGSNWSFPVLQGASVRKKQEVHKLCEANRAYAHYRWWYFLHTWWEKRLLGLVDESLPRDWYVFSWVSQEQCASVNDRWLQRTSWTQEDLFSFINMFLTTKYGSVKRTQKSGVNISYKPDNSGITRTCM